MGYFFVPSHNTQGLSAAQLEQLQLILPSLVFVLNVHLVV